MKRWSLLIRLLTCYEAESCPVRRMRLGLCILQIERRLYAR